LGKRGNSMGNVIILGCGGAASALTYYIQDNNANSTKEKINILGYIGDKPGVDECWKKYNYKAPVLCDFNEYVPAQDEEVLIAIADIQVRMKKINSLINRNARIGEFIHHSVLVPEVRNWGTGNVFFPHCIIEPNAKIGDYNFATSLSIISHDCIIGNNNVILNTAIAGDVIVGNNNFFGIRSTVINKIQIGNNNVIQAGMVVNKPVKDDSTVFYRYKEQVFAIPKSN
jgi:UDP-3-O-[3-hydroxymyristoyl] glucosamine N-acyltransferase